MTHSISATGISFDFAPQGGVLHALKVQDEGAEIAPLHQAPWSPEEVPAGADPHQRWLKGDFLAAPMGEATPHGLHGLPGQRRVASDACLPRNAPRGA